MIIKFAWLPLSLSPLLYFFGRIRRLTRDKRGIPSATKLFLLKVFLEYLQLLELLLGQPCLFFCNMLGGHLISVSGERWRGWSLACLCHRKPCGRWVCCLKVSISYVVNCLSGKMGIYGGRFRDFLVLADLLISEDVISVALDRCSWVGIISWV